MEIKVKKINENAKLPTFSHESDGCADLTAVREWRDEWGNLCIGTGLAFEIPSGYVGLLFARSSISKTCLMLRNHVGVIDAGYRGEVIFKFQESDGLGTYGTYKLGDRVGQIMILPRPKINYIEADELSDTARSEGGFGSTGV